jgi:hypothetical protein
MKLSPGGSGGKNSAFKSVSAEMLGSGSRSSSDSGGSGGNMPRQLPPMPGQEGHQQVRQAPLVQDGKATASSPGAGRENFVAETPPDTLKVSVLGSSRGKSSSCAFSLVEFSNTVSCLFKEIIQLYAYRHRDSPMLHPRKLCFAQLWF